MSRFLLELRATRIDTLVARRKEWHAWRYGGTDNSKVRFDYGPDNGTNVIPWQNVRSWMKC